MTDLHPPTTDSSSPQTSEAGSETLAHLYKMSTTSAGGQEYVAINGMAIAALLLGFGSLLALVSNVLLVVPLASVIFGVAAVLQVRGSNGTQTGRGFAVAGIALALLIGCT